MTTADPLILVARFGAAHGVRGEVRLKSFTADPGAVFDYGPLAAADGRRFIVAAARPAGGGQGDMFVVRLEGLTDRNEAESLNHLDLFVPKSTLPPPEEGEFFHADLIGLRVETEGGERIGTVTAIHDFGAGELLDIHRNHRPPLMLPFTMACVPVVDIAGGRIVAVPPPGLMDDAPSEADRGEH